jgi:aryl-alcohol dehydrogenase-like predicted oxidoreductase
MGFLPEYPVRNGIFTRISRTQWNFLQYSPLATGFLTAPSRMQRDFYHIFTVRNGGVLMPPLSTGFLPDKKSQNKN